MSTTTHLAHHFEDLPKQTHAAHLGMWVFLGSEALLFSGLFALYAGYRVMYPQGFREAAAHTDLALGTAMTFVLITSSFTMASSVLAARQGRSRRVTRLLAATVALAFIFLALKAVEYTVHFRAGIYPGAYYRSTALPTAAAKVFFTLYYFMTGLHALHVLGGIALLSWLAWLVRRGRVTAAYHTPLELGGMYWHFVDMVWIFLWPVFYLLR